MPARLVDCFWFVPWFVWLLIWFLVVVMVLWSWFMVLVLVPGVVVVHGVDAVVLFLLLCSVRAFRAASPP